MIRHHFLVVGQKLWYSDTLNLKILEVSISSVLDTGHGTCAVIVRHGNTNAFCVGLRKINDEYWDTPNTCLHETYSEAKSKVVDTVNNAIRVYQGTIMEHSQRVRQAKEEIIRMKNFIDKL